MATTWRPIRICDQLLHLRQKGRQLLVREADGTSELIAVRLSGQPSFIGQALLAIESELERELDLDQVLKAAEKHAPLNPRATLDLRLADCASPVHLALGALLPSTLERRGVAGNQHTPLFVQRQLAKDPGASVRAALAGATKDEPLIRILAEDEQMEVRAQAAGNQAAPPDLLLQLASDRSVTVLSTLATSPSLPEAALPKLLSRGGTPGVRAVESQPLSPKLIRWALGNTPPEVRRALAQKRELDPELLLELADDSDEQVVIAYADRPNLPLAALKTLARRPLPEAHRALLGHEPHPPPHVLDLIAQHPSSRQTMEKGLLDASGVWYHAQSLRHGHHYAINLTYHLEQFGSPWYLRRTAPEGMTVEALFEEAKQELGRWVQELKLEPEALSL